MAHRVIDGEGGAEASAPPEPAQPQPGPRPRPHTRPYVADGPAYAAIDLGTHNCRMLVAVPDGSEIRVVDSFSRIVRLGEQVGRCGHLDEAAIDRTIEALRVCAAKMRRHRVVATRNVATAACRSAADAAEFVARVQAATGLTIEVIPAGEEARLTLAGCAGLLDPAVPDAVVFDIGGGSTEVSWVSVAPDGSATVRDVHSLCTGVVTLSERHGRAGLPESAYFATVDAIADQLRPFRDRVGLDARIAAGGVQMLGTSGTVTTLGALHLGLNRYVRSRVDGLRMDFDTIAAISRRLAAEAPRERAAHRCIGAQRADLVVAGCAILEAICRLWPVGELTVADRGIREGLLTEAMRDDGMLSDPVPFRLSAG